MSLGLARRTTRPLRRLTETSRRAATGDLAARVEPSGSIELVTLGESFNDERHAAPWSEADSRVYV